MVTDFASVGLDCPNCKAEILIDQCWTAGGMNDYGGYILQCETCQHIFETYLGRDIADSRVRSGATVLETYDRDVSGDKEDAMKRHGL